MVTLELIYWKLNKAAFHFHFSAYTKASIKDKINAYEKRLTSKIAETIEEEQQKVEPVKRITRSKTRAVVAAQAIIRKSVSKLEDFRNIPSHFVYIRLHGLSE